MRIKKLRFYISDVAIICGLFGLVVFGHFTLAGNRANATGLYPLLMQGQGASYGITVNEQASNMEENARLALRQLGSAQLAYASGESGHGRYAWLHELHQSGYLPPNLTGRTITTGYSITFYLPQGKRGFTLIAEPLDFDYRPFMLTENQGIVLLTPSVMADPTESWQTVRTMESEVRNESGRFDYFQGLQFLNYDPPLQVRLNVEQTRYSLHSFLEGEESGWVLDDSLIYSDVFASYMIGDIRPPEE